MSRSVGIEEEFLVVGDDDAQLADVGDEVVDAAAPAPGDANFEHELTRAQVELGTPPATDAASLLGDLQRLRGELAAAASGQGCRLVASGTSPLDTRTGVTPERRYESMAEQFGLVARQQVACGMHVHVAVDDDEAARVLDGIAPWLPVLTALAANSPFHDAQDTGYASYRTLLWGMWPTAGPTAAIGDLAGYRRLTEDLVTIGAARDPGMLYFSARLAVEYPTVELRVCDVCPGPELAVTLAAVARALVEHAATGEPAAPVRPELLRAAAWRAARYGTSGELVDLTGERPRLRPAWELVDTLLDLLDPALQRADDVALVHDGLQAVRRVGTGAERQRAVHARRGELADVIDDLALRPAQ